VYEETRLSVTVGPLLGSVHRPAPHGTFDIHDYLCDVIDGVPRAGDDADAAEWFDREMFTTLHRDGRLVTGLAEALESWNVLPRI
jgi:8-oxo-dGTP diphosphatase